MTVDTHPQTVGTSDDASDIGFQSLLTIEASPDNPTTGESVTFEASSADGFPARLIGVFWQFEDSGLTSGETVTHSFDSPGEHTVRAIGVYRGIFVVKSTTVTVSDSSAPPTAAFEYSPEGPTVGDTVEFDASESSDPGGSIDSYEWAIDGQTVASGDTASYTFESAGDHDVTLTVTDDGETDTATQSVSVISDNEAPTAGFDYSPGNVSPGDTVEFDASESSDPGGSIDSYEWAIDGQTVASGETASYTFESAGDYDVTLTVTDDVGATDATTRPVSVDQVEQKPYGGDPIETGDTIEAENFDVGGEGVAYQDEDSENSGGEYRPDEAVDIGELADGYYVGWTNASEWLEYTVSTSEGTYDVTARVASADGGTLRVALGDGTLGTIEVPDTGGQSDWTTATLSNVSVPAADSEQLRLEVIEGGFNLDWIRFEEHGESGTVLDVESATVSVDETTETPVILERSDTGVSGFRVTVTANSEAATIESAAIASEFETVSNVTVADDGSSATIEAVDLEDSVDANSTDVELADLTIEGIEPGTASLQVTADRFEDHDGSLTNVTTLDGEVDVQANDSE